MSDRKITVSIDESTAKALKSYFPDIPEETLLQTLARLSLEEWRYWLSAERRPKTASALAQERVKAIFDEPNLYQGRQVTRQLLYNQFNLPYGEASYIERVLAEREIPYLNHQAASRICSQLAENLPDEMTTNGGHQNQPLTIEVDKIGQRILQGIFAQIKERNERIAPQVNSQAVHGYYNYTFSEDEARRVLEHAQTIVKLYEE